MMKIPNLTASAGPLTREHWDVPIRVRLVPYVEFSQWMDGELDKLVDHWWDKAAPCAKKNRRLTA
jgi:hypothetical protein